MMNHLYVVQMCGNKPAESRYSLTEGEALVVAWALDHSRM